MLQILHVKLLVSRNGLKDFRTVSVRDIVTCEHVIHTSQPHQDRRHLIRRHLPFCPRWSGPDSRSWQTVINFAKGGANKIDRKPARSVVNSASVKQTSSKMIDWDLRLHVVVNCRTTWATIDIVTKQRGRSSVSQTLWRRQWRWLARRTADLWKTSKKCRVLVYLYMDNLTL